MTNSVADEPPGLYQCGICKRGYKRLDHLSRHARSHSQSRPHKCHLCHKSFTRTDLLKRHVTAHERHSGRLERGSDTSAPCSESAPAMGRVSLACKACSANHLRCADDKPCVRCVNKGVECVWNTEMNDRQAFTPPISEGHRPQGEEPSPSSVRAPAMAQDEDWQPSAESPTVRPDDGMFLDESNPSPNSTLMPFFGELPSLDLLSAQWPQMEVDVGESPGLSGPFEDIPGPFPDTYDFINFEIGLRRDTTHHHDHDAAAAATQSVQPDDRLSSTGSSSHDPGQPAAMCTEAFRNSHWHFRPGTKDYVGADDHNLSLPEDSDFDSPDSGVALSATVSARALSVTTRDKILTMVVKNVNPTHLPKAVACFPSTQLLGTLVHLYLHSPISQASSFLHVATFDPNTQRPELLAAMAASGALLTANPALVKLGLAISETARIAIASLWDGDNTLVRDLQLLQAFCINLDLGLWSGHGRLVEISESFLQPLVTMLRRAGHFRRASCTKFSTVALHLSPDEALNQWLAWIELESFKRLAFRLLQHDTNASISLHVNPIISYTEVQLPLPGSSTLWSAPTRWEWELAYISRANTNSVTIADLMDDPDLLARGSERLDTSVASRAMISLVWMLTWEYTNMLSFEKLHPRQFNALVTKLRLDELQKLLDTVTVSLSLGTNVSSGLEARLELVQLHLYMPLEDVQTFAGMQGVEQARAIYPSIRDWSLSESARRAVYHAAQVIRAARDLPQTFIQGVEAIMVYHASLALWVYGLLRKSSVEKETLNIHLDDVGKDIALRRFLELGAGKPCIRSGDGKEGLDGSRHEAAICLNEPDAVLEAIIEVVRRNFRNSEMTHLTRKLLQLMQELSEAAKRPMRWSEKV